MAITEPLNPLENDKKEKDKKSEKEPEKKPLHGLVVGANVVSILLILGIFFTIYKMSVWRSDTHQKNQALAMQNSIDVMIKDSANAANAYQDIIDSMNNHTGALDASTQEMNNSLKYSQLDNNLGSTGSDGKMRSAMEDLKAKANRQIDAIDKMMTDLDEQVAANGSYDRIKTTQDFFINGGRASSLLDDLKNFRDNTVTAISQTGVDNMSEIKEHLPLDDWSSTTGAMKWDSYEMQGDPDNAKKFLKNIETELRLFEGAALDKLLAASNSDY